MMQPQFCGKWAVSRVPFCCALVDCPLQVLELLLKEWRKDRSNKVLIFTKSVKLIEMLEFHLNTQGQWIKVVEEIQDWKYVLGFGFLKLDGSTKQNDRTPHILRSISSRANLSSPLQVCQ